MKKNVQKWNLLFICLLAFLLIALCSACTRQTSEVILPAVIEENTLAKQEEVRSKIADAYTTTEPPTTWADQNADGKLTEEDLPADARIMYLTFDDGPSGNTPRILDILDEYDCDATFFVINAGGYNQFYKDIVDRGHTIALHTYTHDYGRIYTSEDAYFTDLQMISDEVFEWTGIRTNLMRFPGGSSNTISAAYNDGIMSRLSKEVTDRGYVYFDWNCTNADASAVEKTADELYYYATLYTYDRMVMLMHDNDYHDNTVEALPRIIEHYKDLGYYFIALNENSPTAHQPIAN